MIIIMTVIVVGGGGGGWWLVVVSGLTRLQIWYRWIKLDGRGEDGIMW